MERAGDREGELRRLRLTSVHPNPHQPRKSFPKRQLDQLVSSIRAVGLIQPIVVRQVGDDHYQIVAGERRYRAFQELASEDEAYGAIPAVVYAYDDNEVQVAALVENVMRDDLNPIERAEALRALKKQLGTHWKGVAERVGLSVRAVHFLNGMLKLRREFKDAIARGELTEKHGRALRQLSKNRDAAFDLFEFLMAHTDVTGDRALAIAAVMKKHVGCTAEEASHYLDDARMKGKLPKPRTGPQATPAMQVARGLKTFSTSLEDLEPSALSDEERASLLELIEQTRGELTRLKRALGKR